MVFQWGAELRVFGYSDKSCTVKCELIKDGKVILDGVAGTCEDGSFLVCVPPTDEPDGPFDIAVLENDEESLRITGAYAGEVWLAAGQSNMEYPLGRSEFAKYVIPKIGETDIRFYEVPRAGFMDEAQAKAEEESQWIEINSDNAAVMSAVAFYFASALENRLDAKIGIIGCYVGGSAIDCWQSVDSLLESKEGRTYIKDFDDAAALLTPEQFDAEQADYDKRNEEYGEKLAELLNENPFLTYLETESQLGPGPWPPPTGERAMRHPGSFFECMILRIAPFTLRGVIYYQGETDADGHQNEYVRVFNSLISEWRAVFFHTPTPGSLVPLSTDGASTAMILKRVRIDLNGS